MRRRLFTFFSVVSLLLFVAVCVLWVRSNWVADAVTHAGKGRVRIVSCDGGVFIEMCKLTGRYGDPNPGQPVGTPLTKYAESAIDYREWMQANREAEAGVPWRWKAVPPDPDVLFRGWGSEHGWFPALVDGLAARVDWKMNQYYYSMEEDWLGGSRVWMPYWCIAMAAALLPAMWLRGALRRRRRAGCCVACGYDLRATPDRCPECGAVPANSKARARAAGSSSPSTAR